MNNNNYKYTALSKLLHTYNMYVHKKPIYKNKPKNIDNYLFKFVITDSNGIIIWFYLGSAKLLDILVKSSQIIRVFIRNYLVIWFVVMQFIVLEFWFYLTD